MVSPKTTTLCERYGPGRLPRADNHAIGAGYAAAAAAICVAVAYSSTTLVFDSLGVAATGRFDVLLAALALLVFVPAAFVTGFVGWTVFSPKSPVTGIVTGLLGVFTVYGVALLLFGVR